MSDIVERLREAAASLSEIYPDYAEAADEISRLRAELAAVTEERDRMQHRLDAAYNVIDKDIKNDMAFAKKHADLWLENEKLREALKPASLWRDIESAPKDGTWIFIYRDNWHGAIKAKWGEIDGVDEPFTGWVFQDDFLCIGCAEGCLGYNEDIEDGYMPTHWMPLPEPPR